MGDQNIRINQTNNGVETERDEPNNLNDSGYWTLNLIHIDNNWSNVVIEDWCIGLGTQMNPYVIENVSIKGIGDGFGIFIENSRDFFEIRNCSISSVECGIKIQNATNFNIIETKIFDIKGINGLNGGTGGNGDNGNEAIGIALLNCINGTIINNNLTEISGGNGGNGGHGDWSMGIEDGGNGGNGNNSYGIFSYLTNHIIISNNNISKISGGEGGNGGNGCVGPADWSYDGGEGGNGGSGGLACGIYLKMSTNITNFKNKISKIIGGAGGVGGNGGEGTGGSYRGGDGGNGGIGNLGGVSSGIQVRNSKNITNTWNNLLNITGGDGGNGGDGGDGGNGYDSVIEENEGGNGGNGADAGEGSLAAGIYLIDSLDVINEWNNITRILGGSGGNGGFGGDGGSGVYGRGGDGGAGGNGGSGSISCGAYIDNTGCISNLWNNISNIILSIGGEGGTGGNGGIGFGGYPNGIDGPSGVNGENGTIHEFYYINNYIPMWNDWTLTEIISTESIYNSENPSIALDNLGNVHVAWHDLTDYGGSGSDIDVFYKKWNFMTASWSMTEVISTESTGYSYRTSIGMDILGNVHVVWLDATNYDDSGSDNDIFYKRWNATTAIWSITEVVSTESTSTSWSPSIALDNLGNVHVVWYDLTNYGGDGSNYDIFYKRWNATTSTWSITEWISTESMTGSVFPSIGVDHLGNVHVVWEDATDYGESGSDNDIFYKRWNATTTTWLTTEVVSTESTSTSKYPSMAVDHSGNAHVVWEDATDYGESGSDNDIFYKRWNTTTTTWSTTEVVSTESTSDSKKPSIGLDNLGNLHVAWYDYTDYDASGSDRDIFYKKLLYTPPKVIINSPSTNEFFGSIAPDFNIFIIQSYLDDTWYTIDGGLTNITFTGLIGTINQTEWDKKGNEPVTIRFYANDTFGKEGYSEVTIQKDINAPNSSVVFIPHSGIDVVNESTIFTITADDALGSGISLIRYNINDSQWIIYSSPFNLSNHPYGDIIISYQAKDQVDNYETIQTLIVYRTDTIAPTSVISFKAYRDPNIVIRSTIFTITADDGLGSGISLIRYKINDSNWITYIGPFHLSDYEYGYYNITYQAIDVIGNVEIRNSITISLIAKISQPRILGYNVFLLIGVISVILAIIIRRQEY